jgi:hypothetical protein
MVRKNPVAKFSRQLNRPVTHRDRRKALKKGYQKHKGRHQDGFFVLAIK